MPFAPSSFLVLVMHVATSSVLAPSSDALVTNRDALVTSSEVYIYKLLQRIDIQDPQ